VFGTLKAAYLPIPDTKNKDATWLEGLADFDAIDRRVRTGQPLAMPAASVRLWPLTIEHAVRPEAPPYPTEPSAATDIDGPGFRRRLLPRPGRHIRPPHTRRCELRARRIPRVLWRPESFSASEIHAMGVLTTPRIG